MEFAFMLQQSGTADSEISFWAGSLFKTRVYFKNIIKWWTFYSLQTHL